MKNFQLLLSLDATEVRNEVQFINSLGFFLLHSYITMGGQTQ